MELWDVYDLDRNKTGRTMVRGNTHQKGDYHVVVHVCIFNDKGEMLIQQRQSTKEGWPDFWDVTVGGSAIQGDSSQDAAARELTEELGIQIDFSEIRPHLTSHFERGFDDIYLIEQDIRLEDCILQTEEVQAVKWANRDEILEMIEAGTFIPYFPSFIHLLFDSRRQYGCIQHHE